MFYRANREQSSLVCGIGSFRLNRRIAASHKGWIAEAHTLRGFVVKRDMRQRGQRGFGGLEQCIKRFEGFA